MDAVPVQIVSLIYLAGIWAHPHSAPTSPCPTTEQIAQCSATNNFADSFMVGIDPKGWTTADMDVVCANKDEFVSFHSCLLSAEKQCVGTDHEDLVINPSTLPDYQHFACQEKAKVIGTCVTDNNATITTCFNNAVATITTTTSDYQCLWEEELRKCYVSGYSACDHTTRYVIDVLLTKRRPLKCGCDVIKASISFIVMAVVTSIVGAGKH